MNKKDLNTIRRHTTSKKSTSSKFYGCYVNASNQIISSFKVSKAELSEEELDMYFKIFKSVLNVKFGEKSYNIDYGTMEVQSSPHHKFLMKLDESKLEDDEVREELYNKIIHSIDSEVGYLILLDHEAMDLPSKNEGEDSSEVFRYTICAICLVKDGKNELSYEVASKGFHLASAGSVAGSPIAGFMFPAFNNKQRDIYSGLFYAKKAEEPQWLILDAVFGKEVPKAHSMQQSMLARVLSTSLGDDCTISVIDDIRRDIADKEALAKEIEKNSDGEEDEVCLSKGDISTILESGGIDRGKIDLFEDEFDSTFGEEAKLSPEAVIESKKCLLRSSSGSFTVSMEPEAVNGMKIRDFNGVKYLMIRVDGDNDVVTFNGVPVTGQDN